MRLRFRSSSSRVLLASGLLLSAAQGCGDDPMPIEPPTPSACALTELTLGPSVVGVVPGSSREVVLTLRRDWMCDPLPITFTVSGAGALEPLPMDLAFATGTSRLPVVVTGAREGRVTLTATVRDGEETREASLEIGVASPSLPTCEGSGGGRLAPGGSVNATSGTLTGAGLALAEGAARDDRYHVDAFDAEIGCDEQALPEGYVALGPAVRFESADVYRFAREIDFAIPVRLALLPSLAHRGHVEVVYSGPGVSPRIVPITNPIFEGHGDDGVLRFQAPRLGTYRAVAREDAPTRTRRLFNHRAILGVSMGGSGSGSVGFHNPDVFDFAAPLGGPTDWQYMLEYIRRYHLGGFCTEAEREAGDVDCSAASQERAPSRGELYEHIQHFENWWYEDGYDGQGGRFDRREYIEIFRDLGAMFGNANTNASADPSAPNVTPPGTPDDDRFLPASTRCADLARLTIAPEPEGGDDDAATGYFDDEYNPRGQHPVIAFCDGGEVSGDVGRWNPDAAQTMPFEIAYAVDLDRDGVRDPGEPVIRNGREPFDDFGSDGVPSALEPGYHPVTNPDPAGDDYDFQYNPLGTEGNWDWDEGEAWEDVGLDGVPGTPQLAAGGYDSGEGDGVFTRATGAQRMIDASPRRQLRHLDDATLAQFDVFADGGIRDLFNWAVMGHHSMGGLAARGLPVRFYNGHAALHMDGRDAFSWSTVPFDEVGRYAMVRYGDIDASEEDKRLGDGGHVGTTQQIIDRLFAALAVIDRRWPNGDRRLADDIACSGGPGCPNPNSLVIDFTAPSTGRTGPVTIVLPPGYHFPENADQTYPVVYFLHGYGMDPSDLQVSALLLWNNMTARTLTSHQRLQKMIFVFPDGRCRNQECVTGTFYRDAPETTPNGAQMETFLLDIVDYVDANYRTRPPEMIEVTQ